MVDETKRLDTSSKETQKLQRETEKLKIGETEKLEAEPKRAFPVFLTEGQIVKEKYRVVGVLGHRGGESLAYLCEDTEENRKVVLKLYHTGFVPKEEIVKILFRVTHKDIINVLDFGYISSQFYEIMEYAEGGTLLERLREKAFSEEELIRHVIPEVINGLKFCHSNEIVHRDIKPANIFYRDKVRKDIVISDFGISSLLEQGVSVRKTKGAMTIDYAAPELFGWKGEVYVGKEADYYAFGIVLIHLFLGMSPFEGLTELQIMTQHTSEKIPLPSGFSDKFKKLLSGLLVKERKKRWGASEIECWLRGEDVPVFEDELKVYAPAILPYKFTVNAIAKAPKELAMLIQTFEDRELVKKHFSKGWFSNWLGSFDQGLAYKVVEIEEKARDIDLALFEISCILDPEIPYALLPGVQAKDPEELALHVDKNWEAGRWHIFRGGISIWLKHAGYLDIYDKLEQIRKEYDKSISAQNRGVEIFLQLLGLPKLEFTIEPSMINLYCIESTARNVRSQGIKISHTGKRGYLYGEVRFSEEIEGISFSSIITGSTFKKGIEEWKQRLIEQIKDAEARKDEKAVLELEDKLKEIEKTYYDEGLKRITTNVTDVIQVDLWPGESIEFNLQIDAEKLQVNKKYKFSIVTKTNAETERDLPISFFVDYPAYSKKRVRNSIKIDGKNFHTLKDLAEYYHEKLSRSDA